MTHQPPLKLRFLKCYVRQLHTAGVPAHQFERMLTTLTDKPGFNCQVLSGPTAIFLRLIVVALLLGACTTHIENTPSKNDAPVCHVVYDAGSSRTRLYIYQQTAAGWLKHRGPRTAALADPVRENRGKTMADAGIVVDEIVTALENMRRDGPLTEYGQPEWPAFDWQTQCNIDAAAVYATAGMRLAEQQDAEASELLWKMLNDKLSAVLGIAVTTRTLTGYEEGLFAWLAIREKQGDGYFGVAEMGGASIQVTFPCPKCKTSRRVRVKGQLVPVYSYSFLAWGQDEAWKKIEYLPDCTPGIGLKKPHWKIADCAAGMVVFSDVADDIEKYIRATDGLRWYLSGAFQYMRDTDIEQFCRKGIDSGFEPQTSCFRAVYLPHVLNTLGLLAESEASDVDWTLGAVVCTATRCLSSIRKKSSNPAANR